jgi:hypothetical protein
MSAGVLTEVFLERYHQDKTWGEQNHPDGTGGEDFEWRADFAKRRCQARAAMGTITWRHILDEEVAEAFAESDTAKLRAELIQVAAVATAWVEAIDRREGR